MKEPITTWNGYQVDAAERTKSLLDDVPQAERITLEVRGIVGGDFDVVAERGSDTFSKTAEQRTWVTVLRR